MTPNTLYIVRCREAYTNFNALDSIFTDREEAIARAHHLSNSVPSDMVITVDVAAIGVIEGATTICMFVHEHMVRAARESEEMQSTFGDLLKAARESEEMNQ
jgi:hypothetical protein